MDAEALNTVDGVQPKFSRRFVVGNEVHSLQVSAFRSIGISVDDGEPTAFVFGSNAKALSVLGGFAAFANISDIINVDLLRGSGRVPRDFGGFEI